jgi:hypothetical protein
MGTERPAPASARPRLKTSKCRHTGRVKSVWWPKAAEVVLSRTAVTVESLHALWNLSRLSARG